MTHAILAALQRQAQVCRSLDAPISAAAVEAVGSAVTADGPALDLFDGWRSASEATLTREAVPLRVLAGLHLLVLRGEEPALACAYPREGVAGDAQAVASIVPDVLARRRAELDQAMTLPPQTNEALRSAALLGGFLTVAQETGLPLRCLELGASAGLNQSWDAYAYRLGREIVRGPSQSEVILQTEWRGPPPPDPAWPVVVERRACDQAPIDLADPHQALRLQSFVWADQTRRLPCVRAAIALAVARGVRVERADAVDWSEANVAPRAGVATVLYHSILRQYLDDDGRRRLDAVIARAGEAARADRPFAWLRMEGLPDQGYDVRLTLWPGGRKQVLAQTHPHGEWVAWRAGAQIAGARAE